MKERRYKGLTFQNKIFLIFSAFTLVLLIVAGFGMDYMYSIYSAELYSKSLNDLEYYVGNINEELQEIENISLETALDDNIQELLSNMQGYDRNSTEYSLSLEKLRSLFNREIAVNSHIKRFDYYDSDSYDLIVKSEAGEIPENLLIEIKQFANIGNGGFVKIDPTEEYKYLIVGRNVLELRQTSLKNLGTIVMVCDLKGVIEGAGTIYNADGGSISIYNDDCIIYESENMIDITKLEIIGERGYRVIKIGGEQYFFCYTTDDNGWNYVSVVPYSSLYKNLGTLRNIIMCIYLIVGVLVFLAARKAVNVLFNPVKKLTDSFKYVETGEFKQAAQCIGNDYSDDEIGYLIDEYKGMLSQLDKLVYENYEKQLLIKDSKYKMLLSQINAHFIYNTLNTISIMVKLNQNAEAAQMIVSLGDILRASLSKNPYATVEEEINTATQYMNIQKNRYRERLKFKVEMSDEVLEYSLPRLTLQPILENAVLYGVEATEDSCDIVCKLWKDDTGFHILISDTGPGMSQVALEQLRDGTIKPKGHGIGIANIRERLNMTYENVDFKINSTLGEGTMVAIDIGE